MAVIACPNLSQVTSAMPHLPGGALAVTPSDTDTFACSVTLYVGVAGNIVCSPANGNADVTIAASSGQIIPFRVTAVKATGTTSTGIIAIY